MTEAAKHEEHAAEEKKGDDAHADKKHEKGHDAHDKKKEEHGSGHKAKEGGGFPLPKVSLVKAGKEVGIGVGKVANTLVIKPVAAVSKFIWNRVSTVISSAWDATGGQITGEYEEIRKRVTAKKEPEATAEINGPLSAIGRITSTVFNKIGNVLGGTLSYGVGLPGRMTERALTGTENVVAGAVIGRKLGAANKAAAANDGAHNEATHAEPVNQNGNEAKGDHGHNEHAAA